MNVSDVREGQAFRLNGRVGIVVARDPEDRSSGVTTVHYESGGRYRFVWDYEDPEVEFLGDARLETKIVILEPTAAAR